MKPMTFMQACKDFFGLKPGQTLSDFAREMRELTDADKAEISALFPSVGYGIVSATA